MKPKFETGQLVIERASGLCLVVLERDAIKRCVPGDPRPLNGWTVCGAFNEDYTDYKLHHIPDYVLDLVKVNLQ
jgi:hypothetical protein